MERERERILRVVTFYIHRERGECGSEREVFTCLSPYIVVCILLCRAFW